ncbi:MAG: class II D-tagatose-bisphosphate aldolase, non-catalytic subunit [Asticcacaulis sp.]
MRAQPRNWAKYYHGAGRELAFDLEYSLSDRIRYYWPDAEIVAAQEKLFDNLSANPPPLSLISQYMPDAFATLRNRGLPCTPANLVMAHIGSVLAGYYAATCPEVEMLDA